MIQYGSTVRTVQWGRPSTAGLRDRVTWCGTLGVIFEFVIPFCLFSFWSCAPEKEECTTEGDVSIGLDSLRPRRPR